MSDLASVLAAKEIAKRHRDKCNQCMYGWTDPGNKKFKGKIVFQPCSKSNELVQRYADLFREFLAKNPEDITRRHDSRAFRSAPPGLRLS